MKSHITEAVPCSLLSISTAKDKEEIKLLLTLRLNQDEKYDTITVALPASQSLRLKEDLDRLCQTPSLKSILTPELLEESTEMLNCFILIGNS